MIQNQRTITIKLKYFMFLQMLGVRRNTYPVTGWGTFPSVDLPPMFNWGHVYFYLVESAPEYNPDPDPDLELQECNEAMKIAATKGGVTGVSRKGLALLRSHKILNVKDQRREGLYYVMAEVQRSMKIDCCYPAAIFSVASGSVRECSCDCKQQAMGRCSHVTAMLLGMVQHIESNGHSGLHIMIFTIIF